MNGSVRLHRWRGLSRSSLLNECIGLVGLVGLIGLVVRCWIGRYVVIVCGRCGLVCGLCL